jgi:hypothetical protein
MYNGNTNRATTVDHEMAVEIEHIHTQLKEIRGALERIEFEKAPLDHQGSRYAIEDRAALTLGWPLYLVSWIEIPTLPKNIKNDQQVRTRFLRTVIEFSGAPSEVETVTQSSLLIGKIHTTVWQISYDRRRSDQSLNSVHVIRLGRIENAYRFESAQITKMRIDFELGSLSSLQTFGTGTLKPFFDASIWLGMRLIDRTLFDFRFLLGGATHLGFFIGKRFYIAGKLGIAADFVQPSTQITWGADCGFYATDFLQLKLGLDYSRFFRSTPSGQNHSRSYGDDMNILPDGLSVHSGLFFRY